MSAVAHHAVSMVKAATFAAAYGVSGASGVSTDRYPTDRSYSKQVPTPANRRTPAAAAPLAMASVPVRQSRLRSDVRYLPGSAYQARCTTVSIPASWPAHQSALWPKRSSQVTVRASSPSSRASEPVRITQVRSCPAAASCCATGRPTNPVAPVIRIRLIVRGPRALRIGAQGQGVKSGCCLSK